MLVTVFEFNRNPLRSITPSISHADAAGDASISLLVASACAKRMSS